MTLTPAVEEVQVTAYGGGQPQTLEAKDVDVAALERGRPQTSEAKNVGIAEEARVMKCRD